MPKSNEIVLSSPYIDKFRHDLIDRYIVSIHEINTSSTTNKPAAVFRQLLKNYGSFGSKILGFFANAGKSHGDLVDRLYKALEKPDFDFVTELDNYLKVHTLNKKEDFFSLLIAFFKYYKEFYIDISNFEALKHQIIIPLHIYKEELQIKEIDASLKDLTLDDPKIILATLRHLGEAPIPESRRRVVIVNLIKFLDKHETESVDGGWRDYNYFKMAYTSLSKIDIPKDMVDDLINISVHVITQSIELRKTSDYFYCGIQDKYHCGELYDLLLSLQIPDNKVDQVLDVLFEQVTYGDWPIRVKVWDVIKCNDAGLVRTNNWIEDAIAKLKGEVKVVNENSFLYSRPSADRIKERNEVDYVVLATSPIPNSKKRDILELAFTRIQELIEQKSMFSDNASKIRQVCHVIGNCLPVSDEALNEYTVISLLELLELMPGQIYEGYDALAKCNIPEYCLERVSQMLLTLITRDIVGITNVMSCIEKIKFPENLRVALVSELLKVCEDDSSKNAMYTYNVLVKLGLPGSKLPDFVVLLSKRMDDKTRNCWEVDYIIQALSTLNLPSELKENWTNKLFAYTFAQIKEKNLLKNPCVLLPSLNLSAQRKAALSNGLIGTIISGNVSHPKLEGVLVSLYELAKQQEPEEIVRLQVHIDTIKALKPDPQLKMSLSEFSYQLKQLSCQKQVLTDKLVLRNVISHTLSFIRYKDRPEPQVEQIPVNFGMSS